jgi:FlgD Ig-like domain
MRSVRTHRDDKFRCVRCAVTILAATAILQFACPWNVRAATSPSSRTAVVAIYRGAAIYCPTLRDTLVVNCLTRWGYEPVLLEEIVSFFYDSTTVDLAALRDEINGCGYAFISTTGSQAHSGFGPPFNVPPSNGGDMAAMLFSNYYAAYVRALQYLADTNDPFQEGDFWIARVTEFLQEYYAIMLSPQGMRHLDTLAPDAILHTEWCYSGWVADRFPSAKTILSYAGQCWWAQPCNETDSLYTRLSCARYPDYESNIGSAATGLGLTLTGERDNWMHPDWSCENLATLFRNVRATGKPDAGRIEFAFRAESDAGTRAYRVRGFRRLDDYPNAPQELARLPRSEQIPGDRALSGGRDYRAEVPGGFALYDVVEESNGPRDSWSEPVRPLAADAHRATEPNAVTITAADNEGQDEDQAIYELIGDDWRPWSEPANPAPPSSNAMPTDTCAACGHYVIYVSSANPDWAIPARDALYAQGLAVRVFSGPSSVLSARAPLNATRSANLAWNYGCGGVPGCPIYPVTPGPTLLVVGDAYPLSVSPMSFANPPQCLESLCRSYLLAADLGTDSIPDCPVEVIPASSLAEVQIAVAAAREYSADTFVDPARRVLLVGGDRDAGSVSPWVNDFLTETASSYLSVGMNGLPPILESNFPIGDGNAGIQTATRNAFNAGVAESWFFGLRTDELKFPAWCVSTISDPSNLTRQQRVIVWAPGCRMGAVQSYDPVNWGQPPTSEKLAFNDLGKTVAAAGVYHLDPAYGIKHYAWSRILRDARMSAAPGTAVSRVHYDAVRAWYDQFPCDHYALSTVSLGCRTRLASAATSVPGESGPGATAPAVDALVALDNVGASPVLRFALPKAESARLRIVDTSGRLVSTIRDGELAAGVHRFTWFGANAAGEAVGAGIYFAILETAGGRQDVAKIHIVR